MILLHGTTRSRAEELVWVGPNPRFREAGALRKKSDEGFSLSVPGGPPVAIASSKVEPAPTV